MGEIGRQIDAAADPTVGETGRTANRTAYADAARADAAGANHTAGAAAEWIVGQITAAAHHPTVGEVRSTIRPDTLTVPAVDGDQAAFAHVKAGAAVITIR